MRLRRLPGNSETSRTSLLVAVMPLLWPAMAVAQSPPPQPDSTQEKRLAEANRLANEGAAAYQNGDYEACARLFERAYEAGATTPAVPYNAACCFARLGQIENAFKHLDLATQRGWRDVDHLNSDPDLESLRSDKRWADMVDRAAAHRAEFRRSMTHADLYDELMRRMKVDQDVRLAEEPDVAKMTQIDADNTAWMKQVVEKHGWPGQAMVGRDGAQAAWLLVQHADQDHDFQRRCLDLLTKAYEYGQAAADQVAYLTDRVLVAEDKPQLYGTQFHVVDGNLQPFPIENEAEVDKRRAAMGLGPLADYAAQMRSLDR